MVRMRPLRFLTLLLAAAAVAAAKSNNLNALLDCIAPEAQEPRNLSRMVLGRFIVEEGHISDLEVNVNRLTSPPSANAKFLVVGKGKDRMGEIPYHGIKPMSFAISEK